MQEVSINTFILLPRTLVSNLANIIKPKEHLQLVWNPIENLFKGILSYYTTRFNIRALYKHYFLVSQQPLMPTVNIFAIPQIAKEDLLTVKHWMASVFQEESLLWKQTKSNLGNKQDLMEASTTLTFGWIIRNYSPQIILPLNDFGL